MARNKKFKDRIHDLRLQYGTTKELAQSLGVSERTIYRWLNRDNPPKNLDSTLERKAGNADAIKRREYYYQVEKPRRSYKKRVQMEPFEVKEGALLERPIEIFDALEITNQITQLTKSNRFKKGNTYRITVNIRNAETLEQWNMERKIKGYQIKSKDQIQSLAWQFLRRAYQVEESENLSIYLTNIELV